jgi:hypothetical protein
MNGYVLRKGDLITTNQGVGVITKTTKGYVYYFFRGHTCKSSKETLWEYHDLIDKKLDLKYGSMKRRKKKRTMRTLDLHGVKHEHVDEKVRKFLNFVELPCNIITGKSPEMKKIVEDIVIEYEWSFHEKDSWNTGTLVVTEK